MQVVKLPPNKKINRKICLIITQFIENARVSLIQIGFCRTAGQYRLQFLTKAKSSFGQLRVDGKQDCQPVESAALDINVHCLSLLFHIVFYIHDFEYTGVACHFD